MIIITVHVLKLNHMFKCFAGLEPWNKRDGKEKGKMQTEYKRFI